jgi:hypothetical protein
LAVIIIPAHNEEGILAASLEHLLAGLDPSTAVVVVCNGCTDRTAEVARRFGPRVDVLELEEASKTAALNAGDARSDGFPRVYLDADVSVSGSSMGNIVETLSRPGALAAEPVPILDTSRSSAAVRLYYTVALALHGGEPGDIGGGVYAMAEEGRKRFDTFPPIIADDAYARAHFAPYEIKVVSSARSIVRAPRTTRDLIKIGARSRLGVLELRSKYPSLWATKRAARNSLTTKTVRVPPRLWPLLPVYALLKLLVRFRAKRLERNLETYRWDRDESSR